jgi:riboflavin kinase/FMN adenylyltransferase
MTEATGLLGRPFQLLGQVVAGERRGRILGFPTANLFVSPRLLLPADGVYAAWARVGDALHRAMVNIGVRPTFGSGAHTVEAHLLDFEEEIYGREMRLDFMERLREEQRFGSVEALTEQLNQDLINAKEILG